MRCRSSLAALFTDKFFSTPVAMGTHHTKLPAGRLRCAGLHICPSVECLNLLSALDWRGTFNAISSRRNHGIFDIGRWPDMAWLLACAGSRFCRSPDLAVVLRRFPNRVARKHI